MAERVVNYVYHTTAVAAGASDTTLTLNSTAGLTGSGTFRMWFNGEIVEVTAVGSPTVTVVRGTEGTTASSQPVGTPIYPILSAAAITALLNQAGGSALPWNVIDITAAPYDADYTGTTDCSTAISSALAAIVTAGGYGWIYFPNKGGSATYKVDTGVVFPALSSIGVYMDPLAQITSNATTSPLFDIGVTHPTYRAEFYNLTITGPDSVVSGSTAVNAAVNEFIWSGQGPNSGISNFDVGIYSSSNGYITNTQFTACTTSIYLLYGLTEVTECVFYPSVADAVCISVNGVSGGCCFSGNSFSIGSSSSQVGVASVGSTNCTVGPNAWYIEPGGTAVSLDSGSSGWRIDPVATGGGTAIVDANGTNLPSQFGPDSPITAASTISPTGLLEYVTGTTTIETITPPTSRADLTSPLTMAIVFLDALTLGVMSSGNIATVTPIAAGELVILTYDTNEEVWHPTSSASGGGSLTGVTTTNQTCLGVDAGPGITGIKNTAIGVHSLYLCTNGTDNTAIGHFSGASIVSGTDNTCLGYAADCNTTTVGAVVIGSGALCLGNGGVSIGTASEVSTGTGIAIGQGATSNNANGVALGAGVTASTAGLFVSSTISSVIGTALSISAGGQIGPTTSTRRHKSNIRPLEVDSSVVLKLNAKSYSRKQVLDGETVYYQDPPGGQREFGYVAEEVVKTLPSVVPRDNKGKPIGVHYDKIAILTNEELKKTVKLLAHTMKRIEKLEASLSKLNGVKRCRK